jgi:hypothetical protein
VPSAADVRQRVSVGNSALLGAGTHLDGPCARGASASVTLNGNTDDWSTCRGMTISAMSGAAAVQNGTAPRRR